MRVLHVFTNPQGKYGNPVGIIIDLRNEINSNQRQKIAAESGFSEVVFINDLDTKSMSIYSPKRQIPFAGHAAVGAAYFLEQEYTTPITQLQGINGPIKTWKEGNLTWVQAERALLPSWNYEELKNSAEVEKLSRKETSVKTHTVVWSWIDQQKGLIRARTFASDWGIPEDEANGSGSMRLASTLKREITIHHGKGSVIYARPSKPGYSEVGGLVIRINQSV